MNVRVDDLIRDAIVTIGIVGSHGEFVPYGTGFIVVNFIDGDAFQNIVTARHILDGRRDIHVRVNTKDGGARVIPAEIWHDHPDKNVDCSIAPGGLDRELFSVRMFEIGNELILTPKHIKKADIGLGDEIFVVGMFMQHAGETRNLPIVRGGIISAMPEEKIRTEYGHHYAYLVETRSFGGLSGSPVFVHLHPLRTLYEKGKDGRRRATVIPSSHSHYLMGMMLGHHLATAPKDEVAILPEKDDEAQRVRLNTGIGIVLPFSYIVETIEQPDVMKRRIEAERGKRRSYHSTKSRLTRTRTKMLEGRNPQHREDFNRLLNEAAKKQPQGGKT